MFEIQRSRNTTEKLEGEVSVVSQDAFIGKVGLYSSLLTSMESMLLNAQPCYRFTPLHSFSEPAQKAEDPEQEDVEYVH